MSNPLGRAAKLMATLNQEREALKDPSQYQKAEGAGSGAEGYMARHAEVRISIFEVQVSQAESAIGDKRGKRWAQ
jgi:hypothetical protein